MLYDNPEKEVEPLDLSFRDYVLAYEDIKKTEFYKRDEEYWQKRLPDIFPAPELPVIKENGNTAVQKFIRYESKLTGSQWSAIKNMASQNGLTASGVLMTAYAEVLGRWSKSQKFTINLTRFNRLPIHNQIMDVVGDFTSLTLLSIDNTAGKSFLERCKNLQQQLWSDLAHPYYSGVELEREISKSRKYVTRPSCLSYLQAGLELNRVAAMNKKNILAKWFMAFHKHHRYGLTIR